MFLSSHHRKPLIECPLTVYNSYQIHIHCCETRLDGTSISLCRKQVSLLGDSGIGKNNVNASLFAVYLLKGRGLAFPRGDIALFKGNARGRKLGLELL